MLPRKLILEIMGVQWRGWNKQHRRILRKLAKTKVSVTAILHLYAYQLSLKVHALAQDW
jgi:hypothetical protein